MSTDWVPEPETLYLAVADIMAVHDAIMQRTGDHPGPLRDVRLLEAALARPRMASYYERADFVRQAVVLAIGISQAHAFVDGNKRTAYAALEVFLDLNGLEFNGEVLELADQLIAVASRAGSLNDASDAFEAWLRERVGPRS